MGAKVRRTSQMSEESQTCPAALCGRRSSSRPDTPPPPPHRSTPRPKSDRIEPSTNVFINYIPRDFTEADLGRLCAQYGTIVCSKIMINLETGESRCFGFVRFATLAEARSAIEGLNGRRVDSKRLLAKYAESRERRDKTSPLLYVKRLPLPVDQQRVAQLFSRFGEIIEMVPHVLDSISPEFWRCVIRYATVDEAAAAVAAMNNQIIWPNSRPIHVGYVDPARMSGSFPQGIEAPSPSLIDEQDQTQLLPRFLLV
jgi:RNA recognition motif-containing protein